MSRSKCFQLKTKTFSHFLFLLLLFKLFLLLVVSKVYFAIVNKIIKIDNNKKL